ncbi:MAG TPA: hypothetical protein VEL07_04210 [Planctomycetota bacterium]|nr:hypothetical protein [Planctomycetota bacterium]
MLLPTALAAALVIAFVATLSDPSAPDRSALARREAMPDASADAVTSAPAPTSGKRSQLALDDEAPAAPRAMESEAEADRALATADGAGLSASSGSDTRTSGTRAESLEGVRSDTSDVAILAEQRHGVAASSDPGEGSAPPAEPPSARSALRKGDRGAIAGGGESVGAPPAIMAKPAAKSAPGVSAAASDVEAGIDERLAGVQAGADAASATDDADDADYAALLDEARAFGAAPTEATEATPAPSPLGLSLAWSAPAPAAQIVTDQAGDDGAAAAAALVAAQPASRVATLTLRNGTVGDMLLPAGSLALHGYDRAGRAIWQSPVRAERDTELPGGGTISWQEIVDAPPEVVEVRVHWGPHRSEPIALAR